MLAQIAFSAGVSLCALLPTLPRHELWIIPFLLLWLRQCSTAAHWRALLLYTLAFSIGLAYSSWRAEQRLADELSPPLHLKEKTLIATVRGLSPAPEQRFPFVLEVERTIDTENTHVPSLLYVLDPLKRDWPPGSRWQLPVRLFARRGTANPYGYDVERWMWASGILARGHAGRDRLHLNDATDAHARLDQLRHSLVQRARQVLGTTREAGLIMALTVGVQNHLTPEDWALFSRTGLNHLVAISGLHIGIIAGLVALCAKYCLRYLAIPYISPRITIALVTVLSATAYSLLAGFSIPTRRALFMIVIAAFMQLRRHAFTAYQTLWTALALVLLIDPFAVLAPGLWLSFGLVATLLAVTVGRRQALKGWRVAITTQIATSIVLLVPLALFFGTYPLASPIANMLAIPYVSLVVTPLSLMGMLLPLDSLLHLAAWSARGFLLALDLFRTFPVWFFSAPHWIISLVAVLGTLWLIMPRGFPTRLHGILCLTPFLVYSPPLPTYGNFRLIVFDVGQGLSLLIQTAHHVLLYDTGALAAERVVLPHLYGNGIKYLDKLVLSHHDRDHDGAAPDIVRALPVTTVLAGQAETWVSHSLPAQQCQPGIQWLWDGVHFEVLSPDKPHPHTPKNAQSCVIRVQGYHQSVLLTGDIPAAIEHTLVTAQGKRLNSTLLIAPHHGSKTSSSDRFLDAVAPQWVAISAGYHNRYGHPHHDVVARYQKRGFSVLRTDLEGAITLDMDSRVTVTRFREQFARYWRPRQDNTYP